MLNHDGMQCYAVYCKIFQLFIIRYILIYNMYVCIKNHCLFLYYFILFIDMLLILSFHMLFILLILLIIIVYI